MIYLDVRIGRIRGQTDIGGRARASLCGCPRRDVAAIFSWAEARAPEWTRGARSTYLVLDMSRDRIGAVRG